ncbi:hypothetical protein CANTEDRAFT_96030 [Yamadazyma tenuis ATCC 10573]|nr:uncharacterized protein CANTEDRAFT_96030 [Yamadazyma tenuis ATCC 10573]EGV60581.1 hypothetical protein CANTEDRAFT_96030 [Yamadazyma tenuis ATCC 10573]
MVSRNSPMELLDPLNLLRLRFSRTFYWFNHYFDLFRLLHYQNLSIILKDALHIVNQQLVIFHDKTLMKHKQFLLKQLTLSPPNLDLTACSSTLEKLSSIREIRGAIHLRYSSDIHIPESLHVCWISFNVHKIVTPPYVALKRWRQFFFDKWISSNSQFRFQTGRVASTNKNLDNYDLLKSVTIPSELSVSRLNLFIKNFQLVTGCQLEPVQDISQVDDLKQSILAVGHLSIDPASIFDFSSFEISLLSYWIKHFSFSFEKFQVFENILPFLNNDKYTPELGTASPSLRFPRFYNFLVSNGVRFSFTNLNLCKFSMLSFICTQQIKTLQFFTRLFLHNLVKGELVVDELNTLVLEHLKEFQLQAKAIINNVVHHQLATAYRGQTSSFSRHVTLVQFTQLHGGPKSRVYRVVASRFIEGILSRSANGIFDAQRAEMERFCRSFHRLFRYYYGILHPTLNWIYQDLGL